MDSMARIRVVLQSVVTWAAVAASVATMVVTNADKFPDGVVQIAVVVAAVATSVVSVVAAIRRVTPVEPDQRGILPRDD